MAKKNLPYDSPYESRSVPERIDEEDLTKENCSPATWEALGGDTSDLTDEEFEKFMNGEDFDSKTEGKPY